MQTLGTARLVDVRAAGIPDDLLARAIDQFGAALVNTRSKTWRDVPETERADDPAVLLRRYPTLMKRPLILAGGKLYLGWTDEVRSMLKSA